MDVNDLKSLYAEVTKRMQTALDHVRHELAGVRTGRASVSIPVPQMTTRSPSASAGTISLTTDSLTMPSTTTRRVRPFLPENGGSAVYS